ncbi:MAG: bifunctional oligoribonuclease/PAP phosphatase NrnA [Campylobacterales bacterium]|nr:bifunctional oligoribonuclease/PAP phosphatase NrnA [Campylobacterales bacterium]
MQNQIINTLLQARYVLIISHYNPDADTICSSLAISNFLKENNIKHKLYNKDKKIIPRSLDFLPLFEKITDQIPPFYDVAIYCDSATKDRTGFDAQNCLTINIDHHQSNNFFGDFNLVDDQKSSTAEVVFELLNGTNQKISKNIAMCLYVGIYDDSIGFTTPRVNGRTFEILNRLLETKIDIGYISDQYKRRESLAKYRLSSKIMQTMQLHREGTIATIYCDPIWLDETGAHVNDCDDIVDTTLNLAIVDMVFYFRIVNNKVRVSARSKGGVDVSEIAQQFNGGGHKNAAGMSIDSLDIHKSIDIVIKSI